jgi:hypothetical protein
MRRFKISVDPFHLEYVDIEVVKRLAKIAEDILGTDRLLIRWQKYLDESVKMTGIAKEKLNENYLSAIADYPIRFTGRAAGRLGELAATKTVEDISIENCTNAFLGSKGVHIDAFGNVFSGTCSGIIIGNINDMPLDEIYKRFDPSKREFIRTFFEKGPAGLLSEAVETGYKPKDLYAGKCHLCTDIRAFLLNMNESPEIIGPQSCYEKK